MSDFIFNGKSNDDFDIKVLDIQADIFAGMKHKILDAPGRAIQHLFPQKPAGRRIVIECIIEKSSLTDLSSKALDIAAWLAQDDWKKLELHTVPGKHFMAVLVEPVDTRQILLSKQFTITFEAHPFVYGDIVTTAFVDDTAVVINEGAYPSPVIIEATFVAPSADIKVAWGTKLIRITNNFIVNDVLKIDTNTGAVLINGQRAMDKLDWQNSIFFELAKGDNTLNITPTGKCTATVKHTPRWL